MSRSVCAAVILGVAMVGCKPTQATSSLAEVNSPYVADPTLVSEYNAFKRQSDLPRIQDARDPSGKPYFASGAFVHANSVTSGTYSRNGYYYPDPNQKGKWAQVPQSAFDNAHNKMGTYLTATDQSVATAGLAGQQQLFDSDFQKQPYGQYLQSATFNSYDNHFGSMGGSTPDGTRLNPYGDQFEQRFDALKSQYPSQVEPQFSSPVESDQFSSPLE